MVTALPETLTTDRLRLEPWSEAATPLLAQLARTPAVVRYIGDGLTWNDVKIHEISNGNLDHWAQYGFGWRTARLSQTDELAGFIGLNFTDEGSGVPPGEYEIGWWLAPAVWGRGLAREGALAVRDEAFTELAAPSLLARIQPGNAASLSVAGAIGMAHDRDTLGRTGEPVAVLGLSRAEWRELLRSARPAGPA